MKFLILLASLLCFLMTACSPNDTNDSSGTTVVENGIVTSRIDVDSTKGPLEVKLIPLGYTSDDSSDGKLRIVFTDSAGNFKFENLELGVYNIEVLSSDSSKGILLEGINVETGSLELGLMLMQPLKIINVTVPDSLGDEFLLQISGSTYLQSQSDFIQLEKNQRLFSFSNVPSSPKIGTLTLKTPRDILKNWEDVNTQEQNTLNLFFGEVKSSLRPVWEFPLIVGVSDSMVTHYGGIDVLKNKIKTQLIMSQVVFEDPGLKGLVRFEIDSLYVFSKIRDELALPPIGLAFRLLYSPFQKSEVGHWSTDKATMVLDAQESLTGGAFGKESYRMLSGLLALTRGAYTSTLEEVNFANNPVSNTGLIQGASVTNYRTETKTWTDYNIALINKANSSWKLSPDTLELQSTSGVQLNFKNSDKKARVGALVEFYGVSPGSNSVANNVLFSQTSDSEGLISFENSPFLNTAQNKMLYSNFLLKITHNTEVHYFWLPYSTGLSQYFSSGQSVRFQNFVY
jgi:hypothetical protein